MEIYQIDLHGLSHEEAIKAVEDWLYAYRDTFLFMGHIITGNSPALQKKIFEQVLDPHGYAYYVPVYNLGCIVVGADVGSVLR